MRRFFHASKLTVYTKDESLFEFSNALNKGLSCMNKALRELQQAVQKLYALNQQPCQDVRNCLGYLEQTINDYQRSREEFEKFSALIAKKWIER